MKTTQQYKSLLSPFKINDLEFKNRILLAPMGDNLCNKDGSISKKQERYFLARAKGGCAGIILGSVGVSRPSGQATPLELSLADDGLIEKYAAFCELMHKEDCKVTNPKAGGTLLQSGSDTKHQQRNEVRREERSSETPNNRRFEKIPTAFSVIHLLPPQGPPGLRPPRGGS